VVVRGLTFKVRVYVEDSTWNRLMGETSDAFFSARASRVSFEAEKGGMTTAKKITVERFEKTHVSDDETVANMGHPRWDG
jgi:hypothetical protein